jgi:tetratricopeptide (TPR) repeat protein
MDEDLRTSLLDTSHLERFLASPGIKDYPLAEALNTKSFFFKCLYDQSDDESNLEMAIQLGQCAIQATPEGHPALVSHLNNLAATTFTRYLRTGDEQALAEAIQLSRQITDSTPKDDDYWAGRMNNLGVMLQYRYHATGDTKDLGSCIEVARNVLDATTDDHPERNGRLTNLASQLSLRFKRKGDLADIEEAIRYAQKAVEPALPEHPEFAEWLNNLGAVLDNRYQRTGEIQVLEQAIQASRRAVDATPATHVARARRLNNLANQLQSLFERTGKPQLLEEAIQMAEKAVQLTSENHAERPGWLNNLAMKLAQLFYRNGDVAVLEKVIRLVEEALHLTPIDHPDYSVHVNNLGVWLSRKFENTGDPQDRLEAIVKVERGVLLTPKDHPDRARWLLNLGNVLELQHRRTDAGPSREQMIDPKAVDRALECYIESYESANASPLTRVKAAREAIRILVDRKNWDGAVQLAEGAAKLLHIICGRYSTRADQQHAITQTSGLAADACSLLLKTGNTWRALQLLEFGRGLILGYTIDNRNEPSEVSALKRDHPSLAKRYESLRFRAMVPVDLEDPSAQQLRHDRWEAIRDLDTCLDEIRLIPGYERFLLEPAIEELNSQAVDGPVVVINVTDIGADAVILTTNGIDTLELPGMCIQAAPHRLQQDYDRYTPRGSLHRDIAGEAELGVNIDELSWLWHSCVKVVLTRLKDGGFLDSAGGLSRVWWIGSGIASAIPFHAAGACSDGALECALDQMIPSYVLTVKSLAYSRSKAANYAEAPSGDYSVLVVAMPSSPGQRPLPGADREVAAIENIFSSISSCETLRLPTADQVLAKLSGSAIIHFACHASSDPVNPADSHLVLQREGDTEPVIDRLTLSKISDVVVTQGRAWLAFLSACSTAEVKATMLEDEGLHLAGAFQVAGFAHVVGALWSADDDVCVRVAQLFYTNLVSNSKGPFTNKAVASALRTALLQVRSEFPGDPDMWAPFIHIGA